MTAQITIPWQTSALLPSLRDAQAGDAERLAVLHVECWKEAYDGLLDPQILAGLSVGDRTASWTRQIKTLPPSSRILLVEAAGDLIGFGAIGAQRNKPLAKQGYDGEINALYLRTQWQGFGLGGRLFKALTASLIEHSFRNASLWVLADNHSAVGFYRHLGGTALPLSAAPSLGGAPEIALGWRDLASFPFATNMKDAHP